MSAQRPTAEQRRAADPRISVWVDANAGTGKTRVLTDRVLRLLLDGAPPASLLGLTYTKAAAGEMLTRIGQRLASWATVDDAALGDEIRAITDAAPSPRTLARARGLHDAVLALPVGLAIMTVHGLGQHLLRRFPLEAGVPAGFEVVDDRTRAELLAEARDGVLAGALDDDAVADDLARLAAHAADVTILEAIDALIGHRLAWVDARDARGGVDGTVAAAADILGVAAGADDSDLEVACRDLDEPALEVAAVWLQAAGQKTRRELGAALRRWLEATPGARVAGFDGHLAALATFDKKERPPRWRVSGHLKIDKLHAEAPAVAAPLEALVARLDAAATGRRARRHLERTGALLRLADRVLVAFERIKAERALLDFDDLLLRTRALLEAPGAGLWVRYKLDQAFTHILVDEAQDTNPLQWSLIELLLDEVFGGEGTRAPGERTLFVVGDAKQSIFRFQGADPAVSVHVRARIEARAAAAGTAIEPVALTTSFRSSQAVLDTADALLAQPEIAARLGPSPPHRAFAVARGGRVELWPLLQPADAPEAADPWRAPPERGIEERAERELAATIAATVRAWLENAVPLPGSGRPVAAGDVMILLRRREPMQEVLVRAFKQAGVPVVGADRIGLTGHLAVQDLMALGRAVLLPEDDFAIACILKSPLFGLDDDALFTLAHGRGDGESLQARWRRRAETDATWHELWRRFATWQRLADFVPAYEFYLRVLGGEVDGFVARTAFLERFGNEAEEPIDAFVEQALAYERGHAATLMGFLHWLVLGETTLKRESAQGSEGVRVMTVHGAKGLEAPVVILADAGPRQPGRRPPLLWHQDPALPLWRAAGEEGVAATVAAVDAEATSLLADDLRLLYVAVTRAAEWLVVAGTEPKRGQATSWHERIGRALEALGAATAAAPKGLVGTRLIHATGVAADAAAAAPAPRAAAPLPTALRRRPPPAERRLVLRPSEADTVASVGGGRSQARAVGVHVHRLLERLPALAETHRAAALEGYLDRTAELDGEGRGQVRAHVERVLGDPALAPLFAADAWAEQPVVGTWAGRRIAGQVDRMAVVGGELWLADFKSGRPPPAGAPMPPAHARQLAAYAALLGPLFAELDIRAHLIWTETGVVQVLDKAALEVHIRDGHD